MVACVGLMGTASMRGVEAAAAVSVEFSGVTTSLTPTQLVGGSGTYTFTTASSTPQGIPGFCFAVVAQTVGGTCTLDASGTYQNFICGTGFTGNAPLGATDVATVTVAGILGGASFTFNYGITFVGGIGTIEGDFAGTPVTGWVQITPVGGSCPSSVTEWSATGQVNF